MDPKLVGLLTHAAAAVGGAALAVGWLRTHHQLPPPPASSLSAEGEHQTATNGHCTAHVDCSPEAMEAVAWAGKNSVTPPCHSHFRVYAVVVYERPDGTPAYLTGTNCEDSPYIGGAICAERAALVRLREIPHTRVRELYIVTDRPHYITPGVLCREFMSGLLDPGTPLHLLGTAAKATVTLAQLHPHPSLYATVDRDRIVAFAEAMGRRGERPTDPPAHAALYAAAFAATARDDADALYPMRYAAGVLFDDGTFEVAWQLKALEYGSTLDAVTKLLHTLQTAPTATPPRTPVVLMHVDHCGVLHAPFAQARSLLSEHGLGALTCVLHDPDGRLQHVTAAALAPDAPAIF